MIWAFCNVWFTQLSVINVLHYKYSIRHCIIGMAAADSNNCNGRLGGGASGISIHRFLFTTIISTIPSTSTSHSNFAYIFQCYYAMVRWSSEGSRLRSVLPTCTTAVSLTSMTHIPPSIHQSPTDTTPTSSSSPQWWPAAPVTISIACLACLSWTIGSSDSEVAAGKHRKVHCKRITSAQLDVHRSEEGVGNGRAEAGSVEVQTYGIG